MSEGELKRLYDSALMLVNMHGGTEPRPELYATDRLVYLETDPVQLQAELHEGVQATFDFLEPHCAFFSYAENYGNPDCGLPFQDRFPLHPTRQPVIMDFWQGRPGAREQLTTIGNWRQPWRDVILDGERYSWSKHNEFMKFIDLPQRTSQPFELALSSYDPADQEMLEGHGWQVRHALDFSIDPDDYRDYITGSRGEYSVAKDQNVRLRTGWFSDRSATLPGRRAAGDQPGHRLQQRVPDRRGAVRVLHHGGDPRRRGGDQLRLPAPLPRRRGDRARVLRARRRARPPAPGGRARSSRAAGDIRCSSHGTAPFTADLDITPVSRRPTRLPHETVEAIAGRPVPERHVHPWPCPAASIVIVTHDNLLFSRMTLESVIACTEYPGHEVIVVDNGSRDGTAAVAVRARGRQPSRAPGDESWQCRLRTGVQPGTGARAR